NLALTMSAADRRVLLIEADLRQPKLADYLGVERAVGLTDVLVGHVRPEDVLQPWGDNGLEVLPSGHLPPNPSELLGSDNMARLMAELREQFDLIVLDTPPLLPVTDAAVAATQADGVLLVARWGRTTRQQVENSLHALQVVNARVLGSVLTMVPSGRSSSAYGAYGTRHVESVNEPPVAEPTGPSPFVDEVARGLTPRRSPRRTELQDPVEPVIRTPQGRR
ncbi:MAG TPA: CpsD/CapB family tyrosine-protein kinase, partial [Microthrixaceae bacterium]|nr:CpsD/CapB family tyrosine-protein kinase [Microthrixaceae bacterium]